MATIFNAINELGEANKGLDDRGSHKLIKQTIKCITKGNTKWPTNELCKTVFDLKNADKRMFLSLLVEMDIALDEHFKQKDTILIEGE